MSRVYFPKALIQLSVLLHDYGNQKYSEPFYFTLRPLSVNVNRNSYKEADTFTAAVRFEDLPFDPRILRVCRVRIIIEDTQYKDIEIKEDNLLFAGFMDDYTISINDTERVVTFTGRDYTSVFIEANFDNANLIDPATGKRTRKINKNRPVIDILKDLISNVPAASGIQIVNEIGDPAIKNFARSVPSYDLVNGLKSTDGQTEYVNPNRTYWDVIVSLCEAASILCYIDLDKLVLTNPRLLFQTPTRSSKKTAQMIFGHNLSSLEFRKNLGKKKKFNIVLRSFSVKTGKATTVALPRDGTDAWLKRVGETKGKNAQIAELDTNGVKRERNAPAYTVPMPDGFTKEQLVDAGEKLFEEYYRQDLEGICETMEMSIEDQNGVEFDITQIKTGTPIKIEILLEDYENLMRFKADGGKVSDAQRQEAFKKRIGYLVRRGYPERVANRLVEAVSASTGRITPTFYCMSAEFSMTPQGFSCRIGFVNYLTIEDFTGV